MSAAPQKIYRISFVNDDVTYQVYAKHVGESDMFGFIEIESFVFGETTQLLVDPSEEKVKNEFAGVKRTYIPMHSILRIDEVDKEGISIATPSGKGGANISPFPNQFMNGKKGDNS